MFIVTKVEVGRTTVVSAETWTDVIPMLKIKNTIRRMSIKEDGKLILLVKNPPYERKLPNDSILGVPNLCSGSGNKP